MISWGGGYCCKGSKWYRLRQWNNTLKRPDNTHHLEEPIQHLDARCQLRAIDPAVALEPQGEQSDELLGKLQAVGPLFQKAQEQREGQPAFVNQTPQGVAVLAPASSLAGVLELDLSTCQGVARILTS